MVSVMALVMALGTIAMHKSLQPPLQPPPFLPFSTPQAFPENLEEEKEEVEKAPILTDEEKEKEDLRRAFNLYDLDGGGSIGGEELFEAPDDASSCSRSSQTTQTTVFCCGRR